MLTQQIKVWLILTYESFMTRRKLCASPRFPQQSIKSGVFNGMCVKLTLELFIIFLTFKYSEPDFAGF
jgi:hypothetical protein